MKRTLTTAILLATHLTLAGCYSPQQFNLDSKPGGREGFDRDRYQCAHELRMAKVGWDALDLDICMRGKGWRPIN